MDPGAATGWPQMCSDVVALYKRYLALASEWPSGESAGQLSPPADLFIYRQVSKKKEFVRFT